jgi:HlyD family secretion protein
MDRDLDLGFRRRRLAGRLGRAVLVAGLLAGLLLALPAWLRPSLDRSALRTARVDRGPVEAVLSASGTAVPAFEKILSSPIETRVLRILKRPGESVHAGDPILELDTAAPQLELGRLEDSIDKKRNEEEQLRLGLELRLVQLDGQAETARADLEVVEQRAAQSRKLAASGLLSAEALHTAEAELKKARISLEQIERTAASERRATSAQIEGLELDLRILGKDRDEAKRQLELATTRSDRDGVLTWVVPTEGASLRRGDPVARVADLGSFRVEATVSDIHAGRLSVGLPVRVLADGQSLTGRLASVDPTIVNGAVKFTVELDEAGSTLLRNNLHVDVLVVTARHEQTLLVRKGPFIRGGADETVFVVSGDEAIRRSVKLGLQGADHVEVLGGLEAGDEIIISDLRDYDHLGTVRLR